MLLAAFNDLLKQAGCNKKAFARLLGKDASTVSRWGAGGTHGLPVPQYAQVTLRALIKLDAEARKQIIQMFTRSAK